MADPLKTNAPEVPCQGNHSKSDDLREKLSARNPDYPFKMPGCCLHGENLSEVDFSKTDFSRSSFQAATLFKAVFTRAVLRDCNFRNSKLQSANFSGAILAGADLRESSLQEVNFSGANLLGAKLNLAELNDALFQNTRVHQDAFGPLLKAEKESRFLIASEIYLTLRLNFEALDDYSSASWAHYRERVCRCQSHGLRRAVDFYGEPRAFGPGFLNKLRSDGYAFKFWIKNKSWLYWLNGKFQDWLWGFAQKPERILFWAGVLILAFTLLYWQYDLVCYGSQICGSAEARPVWGDYLLFSLASFSTSAAPNLMGTSWLGNVLASLEGILGVTCLALFTTSLASKLGGI